MHCLIKDKNNQSDINGYGLVDHNFLIQQCFISCEEYANFLNSINIVYKNHDLDNQYIYKVIDKQRSIFKVKENIDPHSPIRYISLNHLKIYCNWINTKNLKYLFEFPYNLYTNKSNLDQAEFWIPNYDEWYKAVYYDSSLEKYWLFPNKTNLPNKEQTLSPYGLIDAGFKYYTLLDNSDNVYAPKDKYIIAGGANNRHPINAKSGTIRYVSDKYYAGYISGRLCKKSETKKFILKLYDTYGDGWGENNLCINNASHKPIYTNISLKNGYGPSSTTIEVDKIERNINIKYMKNNSLSYENYYEIYDFDTQLLIFKSNMYETPPENLIIALS
jgi:hypothetical protein